MTNESKGFIGKRFEFKYALDPIKAKSIENFIRKFGVESDLYSGNGPYEVHSIYFETPFLDDYRDKDGSLLVRKKLRVRWYGELNKIPSIAFLEIKNKRNQTTNKERIVINNEDFVKLVSEEKVIDIYDKYRDEKINKHFIERFAYLYLKGRYKPFILVSYERSAYLGNYLMPFRITFDSKIKTCFSNKMFSDINFLDSVAMNTVIMEVKFNGQMPWWFSKFLKEFQLNRQSFSKYSNSVDTLYKNMGLPISR